jgi:hypothetical protein
MTIPAKLLQGRRGLRERYYVETIIVVVIFNCPPSLCQPTASSSPILQYYQMPLLTRSCSETAAKSLDSSGSTTNLHHSDIPCSLNNTLCRSMLHLCLPSIIRISRQDDCNRNARLGPNNPRIHSSDSACSKTSAFRVAISLTSPWCSGWPAECQRPGDGVRPVEDWEQGPQPRNSSRKGAAQTALESLGALHCLPSEHL